MATLKIRARERAMARALRKELFKLVDGQKDARAMDEARPYTMGALEVASWVGVVLAALVVGVLALTVLRAVFS